MKSIFLAISLLSPPDYDKLANAIKQHENSIKFPYGVERIVNGKPHGFPGNIARQKCIALCQKVYSNWNGKGDYFQCLNKIYARDSRWYISVESIYNHQNKITKKEK